MFKFLIYLLVIFLSTAVVITLQGFIKASVASKLGCTSEKLKGRLEANPFNQINLAAFIGCFFGLSWSKPLDINPSEYKKPVRDSFLVYISVLLFHLFIVFLIIFLILYFHPKDAALHNYIISEFRFPIVIIVHLSLQNIALFLLNLLPLPGLCGFDVLKAVLKRDFSYLSEFSSLILLIICLLIGCFLFCFLAVLTLPSYVIR